MHEIQNEINKLNPTKSGGADNMSPKIVRSCNEATSKPISHLINLSFATSTIPDKLKIAKVISIFKKNEKFIPGNYYPISLLSTINKLIEKMMYKRLISFLNKYHILYDYQFGFRQNHSTSMDLIEAIDNFIMILKGGNMLQAST